MANEESNRVFGINLTLALPLFPAYIYFCTFIYEVAFCERMRIPRYLISPNLTTILIFATSIWTILISSFKIMGLSTPLFKVAGQKDDKRHHLKTIYMVNGLTIVLCIVVFYAYPFSIQLLLGIIGFLAFTNFITWGMNFLFIYRQKKSMKEKLIDAQNQEDKFDLVAYLMTKIDPRQKLFILMLALIAVLSYFIGDGQALKQETFETLANKPNVLVLRKYDDLLICSTFDRKSHQLGDSLIIFKLKDMELILKSEKLGHILGKR